MRKVTALIIAVFLAAFSLAFLGCVTDTTTVKIEKSLPQNKLVPCLKSSVPDNGKIKLQFYA